MGQLRMCSSHRLELHLTRLSTSTTPRIALEMQLLLPVVLQNMHTTQTGKLKHNPGRRERTTVYYYKLRCCQWLYSQSPFAAIDNKTDG